MCGRFASFAEWQDVQRKFSVEEHDGDWRKNYNVAPTQTVAVILDAQPEHVSAVQWGLIPSWSREPKMLFSMINARAETLAEKPSYKDLVKRHRCVVIASGFYEWQKKGKLKQPYERFELRFEFFGCKREFAKGCDLGRFQRTGLS